MTDMELLPVKKSELELRIEKLEAVVGQQQDALVRIAEFLEEQKKNTQLMIRIMKAMLGEENGL